jgi:multicomponent Na+:H+ antiporter subunit G
VIGDLLSAALIVAGLMFFLGAAVGLVRFPDFYTRMHAAGKGDTLSTLLILAGCALFLIRHDLSLAEALVALKILGIGAFIMITSPTSTHALMQAGYEEGQKPYRRDPTQPPPNPRS